MRPTPQFTYQRLAAKEGAYEQFHVFLAAETTDSWTLRATVEILKTRHEFRSTELRERMIWIETQDAGAKPNRYNAERRLIVASEVAVATAAQTELIKKNHKRPIPIQREPASPTDQFSTRHSEGMTTHRRNDELVTYAKDVKVGAWFSKPVDDWRMLNPYASSSDDSGVIALLLERILNVVVKFEIKAYLNFVRIPGFVDIEIATDAADLAEKAWKWGQRQLSKKIQELPYGGADSNYEPEFNDERDRALAKIASGAKLAIEFDSSNRRMGSIDGQSVDPVVVDRLLASRLLEIVGDRFAHRRVEPRHFELKKGLKLSDRQLRPRNFSVSFRSFETYCPHRRHWSENECLHKEGSRNCCAASTCPLVEAVYLSDADRHGSVHDEPHFNAYDENWDTQVVAIHRNTERSSAFRSAGRQRVEAIVQIAANAYASGIANYLVGDSQKTAAEEAIEAGYLTLVENNQIGIIVTLSPSIIAQIKTRKVAP